MSCDAGSCADERERSEKPWFRSGSFEPFLRCVGSFMSSSDSDVEVCIRRDSNNNDRNSVS